MNKVFTILTLSLFSVISFGQTSPYCNTEVTHFAGDPPSAILLTVENTGPSTMEITAESADADPVDLLIVLNGSGAIITGPTNPSPGVFVMTLTWTGTPPADVFFNLLWSKVSFGGNWQLSMTDVSISFEANCIPLTAPITNAPEPTCPATDVVSIYGDFYPTNIATNYDPNWGQSGHLLVNPAYDPGTGDVILAYPNFNYQGTELVVTDLSGMDFLHFDVWTAADPTNTILQVSPINMGTGPAEILVTAPYVSGEWTSVTLAKSDFGGMTWDAVFQMKFAANGPGSTTPVDIYLDNIYFSTCGSSAPTAPTTNAPEPTCPAADVVSIYGDFYPTNIATNYDPNWGQSGHTLVNPSYDPGTGNVVLAYPNFNYQGTELVTTDLSGMDFLHFDVWTAADPANTILQVSPINMGTGPAEILVTAPFTSGEWTSIVLAKSDFGGMTWDAVFQMKFAANGPGSTTPVDIYLDNIYFSTCAPTAPVTNAMDPMCDPSDVVSIYGDFYPTNIATNYDPNWGQSGHTLVDPSYDPGTGNVVLAYPNFNYQGTELTPTDLSGMDYLHFDVWTSADPASTFLQVSPINQGTGPAEVLVDVPYVSGEWTSVYLDKSEFGGMTWDLVFQMKFAANGPGSLVPVDIYLDNIYFATNNCPQGIQSPYCNELVTHFAGDPPSSAFLTIQNTGPNTMEVSIESADGDPIDDLVVQGGNGAMIPPATETSPGVYSTTLTWTGIPPSDVDLTILWSKVSFGGNWLLSTSPITVPFEGICPVPPPPCTLSAAECVACETCEESIVIDLNSGTAFNDAAQFGQNFCCFSGLPAPTYDNNTNSGTWTLPAGAVNAYSAGGVNGLKFPDYVNNICLTADLNVVSGPYPFLLEFRIENGTGAPGNGGQALTFDVMVDGEGGCSIGGGLSDGIPVNGFTFVPDANYSIVVALADFSNTPVAEDIVVEISNINLSICAGDDVAPDLVCQNSEELILNGDFSNVITPSAFPVSADFANWVEIGNVFDDAFTAKQTVKLFGNFSGIYQDAPVLAGEWLCGYTDIITTTFDNIVGFSSWAEIKIEFYDAGGTLIQDVVLAEYDRFVPATANVWTTIGGCVEAPINAVNARLAIFFQNPSFQPGSVVLDNATMKRINPVYFEANADGCTADAIIVNPTPSDNCDVVSFSNDYNNTDDASDNYPQGKTLVTYTAIDAQGNESYCSILVEVGDMTGPEIDCPNDIFIQLEAGECEEVALFEVPFSDICGTIDAEMSQLVNDMLVNTALDCANNTSNHLRYFENTLPVPIEITQVNFGVFNSGVNETVTVNVYMIGPGAPFVYANMVLMGSTDVMVPAGMNTSILTANVDATIPAGMNYVLELKANNTTNFVIGYNNQGETESTYISGNPPVPCVSLEPVNIDLLGPFSALAVVLYSNAQGGPAIEQTGGLPSGSYFPIGTTTNTFIATDVNGNTSICEFDVTVVEYYIGVGGALTCNDNLNISLDLDCQLDLNADMLLEGGAYGCYDDYIIEISGGVVGSIITEPGTYTVTITDPDSGNSCWSNINVESKALPIIDCTSILCPIDMLQGEWTEDDNTFSPGAAWAFDGFAPNNNILYDVIKFVVEVPGIYTLTMTPSPDYDGIAGIYVDNFDPTMPAINLIGGDDDIVGVFESEPDFMIFLDAGTYFLVSSTWGAGQMGPYSWTFSGPGDLLSACDVKCYELDGLLSGGLNIPSPEVTSCIAYELFHSDEVNYNDCGLTTVTRTYLAQNANGSSTCEVVFEIEPVSLALDITLPPSLVELPCNAGTSPAEIAAFYDDPATKDNVNTAIIENNEGYSFAYPTYEINGHIQKVDNSVCNISALYTDQYLAACGGGCAGNTKVIRTWTILDWCNASTTQYVQVIKAVDNEGPTYIAMDFEVSTDPWGCSATVVIPHPWELHDNCDANPTYYVQGPVGTTAVCPGCPGNPSENWVILNAPKGTHTISYYGVDCCGNVTRQDVTLSVVDATPPVAVAFQNIVVSLTSSGTSNSGLAKIYTNQINNGSHDGCSAVHLEVRRDSDACGIRGNATYNADGHPNDGSPNPTSPNYDGDNGEYVKFCCSDLTDVDPVTGRPFGMVKVWLRVWDDGDMNGAYGTDGDNYNETWAMVRVEDKLAPAIVCPPDVELTCDMDYTDLAMTGEATAYGTCDGIAVEWRDLVTNLNACGAGFVIRRWNIVGNAGIFCDQRIDLLPLAPFNGNVNWPRDLEVGGCPDMVNAGEPSWTAGPCDVIGFTVETDTFKFEDGACFKLVNHWTVIDWCTYAPNAPGWDGEGLYEHTQIIKVFDDTKPEILDCEDKMFGVDANCQHVMTLTNSAHDDGSENCPTAWLKWQVFVDLWADGSNDYEFSSFLPSNDSQFNDTNGNGIPDRYVAATANDGEISITIPEAIVGSMSNHKVVWKVTDGCGNNRSCSYNVMVVDKKDPTPYCVNISSAVMENGQVELWASDFNVNSFDNCTAQSNLLYTFEEWAPQIADTIIQNRLVNVNVSHYFNANGFVDFNGNGGAYPLPKAGTLAAYANGDLQLWRPDLNSSAKVFTCDDLPQAEVHMTVWDEKLNSDYCVVYLSLVDNQDACGGNGGSRVAGSLNTESGDALADAAVYVDATMPEYPKLTTTDASGAYAFNNLPNANDFQITASNDVDYKNGVSTLDLVLIQRHILGLTSLDSPYKMIAADVNNSESITASDLTQLRKLILGLYENDDLPNNESWRFVVEGSTLNASNPWPFVEVLDINALSSDMLDQNFVATKIGDVNGSAELAGARGNSSEVRSSRTINLTSEDRNVEAGETVVMSISSEDFADVYGYQFTMNLNGLSYAGVNAGAIEMNDSNVGVLASDKVTMSWNTSDAVTAAAGAELFTVTFVAERSGRLSEMVAITSEVTVAEAYAGANMSVNGINLNLGNTTAVAAEYALGQNEPNPFKGTTVISYTLPEAANAVITVFDVTGKVVIENKVSADAGVNTIAIQERDLNGSGVYYYQLRSGDYTATKKMIIIE